MATESTPLSTELRLDLQEFYFRYAECLDGGRLQQWPEFFADACSYRVCTRRGLRTGGDDDLMSLTGKTAMRDRIVSLAQSEDFEPHLQRHFISNFRIQASAEGELRVQANFHVLRTYAEQRTESFVSGYYLDRVAMAGQRLSFREKVCVLDSEIPPPALVYPL
jgi:3-phenylpropionate/cinnamic acid dioxygenase small subunit